MQTVKHQINGHYLTITRFASTAFLMDLTVGSSFGLLRQNFCIFMFIIGMIDRLGIVKLNRSVEFLNSFRKSTSCKRLKLLAESCGVDRAEIPPKSYRRITICKIRQIFRQSNYFFGGFSAAVKNTADTANGDG